MPAQAAPASAVRQAGVEGPPYEHLGATERYLHETRDRAWRALLRRHVIEGLTGRRILELGCGEGSLLRTLLRYGAGPERLEGIDIDSGKLERARALVPGLKLAEGSIASLPYGDGAFDLAFAFTVFSSVLDAETRRSGAAEALRVLRPGGLLLLYDFWTNPLNRRVRPVSEHELRGMFAPRRIEIERVTLAP
ncbi:MAG: class I SAM-dependent methyltransferase, partial [Dehalococcoidia bacterium]|nr:class I SAM-dependent methyltransferase [Dehalococcoidia bacterium]